MENLSYVALSRQLSLFREMNLTANNIANMSTAGYKGQNMLFVEYLNSAPGATSPNSEISQVQDFSTYRDNSQGPMKRTNNSFDFAIQGEGFFAIQTKEGTRYTRDGSFMLNGNREIVTRNGDVVEGDGGAAIIIPEEVTSIKVTADGTVTSEAGEIGKIKLVTFGNINNMVPVGHNLFDSIKDKEQQVQNPNIQQGMIEGSNVQPVLEMTRMIEIQRMFEATQNLLRTDHERQRNVIQKLTKV